MASFTPFGKLPPELRGLVWDAAIENIHDGPQVVHVRIVGITANKQGRNIADIKHTPETITETQDARNLAGACNEARDAVRKYLSSTLPLRGGELWFRGSEDIITTVVDHSYNLGIVPDDWNTSIKVLGSIIDNLVPTQDLQIGRLGIDMTGLSRQRVTCHKKVRQSRPENADPLIQRLGDLRWAHGCFLDHTHVLFSLLQWLFPASGIYAVWDDQGDFGFYTSVEARRAFHGHRREFKAFVKLAGLLTWIGSRYGPEDVCRYLKLGEGLENLRIGHIVYSHSANGSGHRIKNLEAPKAIVS